MKKITFQNSRNKKLVGNLYSSDSKSIIIMSHGFTGDKSEWGRFDKIAVALNKAGYNVLTFDFSGCGESDDDTLTVNKQVDDLKSALKFVKSKRYKKIGLFGHSLGGLISLNCFSKEIETMVLTAPVTDKIKYTWDKRYTPRQLKELEKKGYITKIMKKGVRRKILIDKQMLIDRESVNQKKLLKNVKCPVLIIHGNKDLNVPLNDSKNAIKHLSNNSKLEVIEGADHDMWGCLDILIEKTVKWFKKYL